MAVINGEDVSASGKPLLQYLMETGYDSSRVVVERNLEIVPQDQLESVIIQDEDSIEILRFVGGGGADRKTEPCHGLRRFREGGDHA